MRLFIAEKPSLARAIAEVLPRPHTKEDGCIRAASGDVVSWCIGHLLEQAEPEAYDAAFRQWRLEHLPIIPQEWQLVPKSKTRKQLTVLRKLIKEADELVHAGDPDREGQLLVDEVIAYLKTPKTKRRSAKRLLISDLNPEAVSRSLGNLRNNSEFIPLSVSALARSRADWLYGINLTRAWTIKGQQAGNRGVLSVGRVQTPVLGLVVRRDQEIHDFVSKPFYNVRAAIHLTAQHPLDFYAHWQPSEACRPHQDDEGRVLNPKLAENVVERIRNQPAQVSKFEKKPGKQAAPLPYNLSSLQIDAAKAYGMAAKSVLDTCQSLYEKHQLITYPRSDCRYLPVAHHKEMSDISEAIKSAISDAGKMLEHTDKSRKSAAFNDKKVGAHHAIIPTSRKLRGNLNEAEKKIYRLISRQYLMQFCEAYRYSDTRIDLEIAGGLFSARERITVTEGWKALMPAREKSSPPLPDLVEGQTLWSGEPQLDEKHTEPPKHYTDATLLAAMTGIARYVKDPELRKVLKDTDGLGTEATRAGIVELLFKRRFLQRVGKQIQATDTGRQLIAVLPDESTQPDMTAQWEQALEQMSEAQISYEAFMAQLNARLHQLISGVHASAMPALVSSEPGKNKSSGKRFRKKKRMSS
ncbi:DNA topoisomerase III [uncultured Thalassolituus sp.]|uniref:DNA topoisomerase III n=1 Tax=uncultured Thalassolituus sp. TaxID=285273 RepID=UPI0026286CE0|nr:DNA topoisomerase III [uncultured Thalassolituus sp.]